MLPGLPLLPRQIAKVLRTACAADLVGVCLIASGLGTIVHVIRLHIYKTRRAADTMLCDACTHDQLALGRRFYFGTGIVSVRLSAPACLLAKLCCPAGQACQTCEAVLQVMGITTTQVVVGLTVINNDVVSAQVD